MANIFTTIQVILSLISPFLFVHYFSQYFYNISLWNIVRWWASNHSEVHNSSFYFIGLFFILLFLFFSFSGFINILLLSLFGEKQELVYLGHNKQSTAVYYDMHDFDKKTMSGHDYDIKYNYSFDDLFRTQRFVKDPGSSDRVGTKSNRINFLGFITVSLSVVVIIMAGAAFFNVFVYPVYNANPTDVAIPLEGAELAFDNIIGRYGITRGWYFGCLFVLIFVWVGFILLMPKNELSKPVISLPVSIISGNTIEGIPKEIEIRYLKRRRSGNSDTYENVDSGERYITFEFNERFSHPVYVTTLIDLATHNDQIDMIRRNIEDKRPMKLNLSDSLKIILPVSLDNSNH